MNDSPRFGCGRRLLVRYLAAQTREPHRLDAAGFRAWLAAQIERQATHDRLFVARCALRDRVRQHRGVLAPLYERRALAARALADSGAAQRLREIDEARSGAARALVGLDEALASASGERREALTRKRASFVARLAALDETRGTEVAHPMHEEAAAAERAVEEAERALGVRAAQRAVEEATATTGARANRSGRTFERQARTVVQEHVVREVLRAPRDPERAAANVHVLTGVTLGAARAELDFVVVRGRRAVEVLAVVEAKADPNDIGHGFVLRQENLAFFTGLGPWSAEQYRTAVFRHGRFDKDVVHDQGGESFTFAPNSFRRFRRTNGWFLDRLFFVSRDRPLRGLSSAWFGRLMYRVSTDPEFDLHEPAQVERLRLWLHQAVDEPSAAEVLNHYAADARLARRICWIT